MPLRTVPDPFRAQARSQIASPDSSARVCRFGAASAAPAMQTRNPFSRGTHHSAHHWLLFGSRKRARSLWLVWGALALGGVAVAALFAFTELDWSSVTRFVENLDPWAVLPLMAVLPIFGFPIVMVYLVAGARFGPVLGGVVVAAATAFHLLGTHAIARSVLRGPIERLFARRRQQLPQVPADEHAAVALIAALVPGLPYAIRNYLLALGGVRLRTYFWICLPIYVARSYVTILLGDMSSDPSGRRLVILFSVDALKVALCAYVIWRLREHHRRVHGAPAHPAGSDVSAPPSGAAM
jgi:uncharacterized membrane protein YdjX (TVP38/TMEM64 family)